MSAKAVLTASVSLVGLWLLGVCAWAQPGGAARPALPEPTRLAPREPGQAAAKRDNDQIRVRQAERARYDSRRGLFYLSGNIVFEDEDVKLYADEANYNENDDTAACAGHLRVVDPENVITGDAVSADFEAEIAIISGNVKIVTTKTIVEQRPAEGEAAKPEGPPKQRVTTITCDKIVYTYTEGKRRAVATGELKAVQEDKTVYAPKADYDREKDIVVLGEPVKISMENGNQFECKRATISVTDNWVDMEGFTGVAVRTRKTPAGQPPAGGAPPAPPPASGEGGASPPATGG
jgi:lipopolysaccharide assembly outer membrane protein LptD (OstA)